jgi:pseudouridine kinase
MSNNPKITVIGAANIDLIGFSNEELIYQDSNTGHLETILGGVGRNIAENLKHLDFDVEFLTVLADDEFSKIITDSCNNLGLSITHSLIKENSKTSIFMAIMDKSNDMALGLTAMDIYDDIPDAFILDNLDVIAQSDYCVIETNLPTSTLELVTKKLPNVRFALEAVSAKKALKAKPILDKLYILKCNAMEAELLSGIKVNYEIEYEKVVAHFLELGVKKVFITLGIDGVAYGDENEIFIDKNKIIAPVNTTGAGDAFMAGILYGETKGMELYDMVQFASACAQITIMHQDAVNPDICIQKVLDTLTS